MSKSAFSFLSILALSHFTYAGDDLAPIVEPIVETPVVEDSSWDFRLSPYGWFAV